MTFHTVPVTLTMHSQTPQSSLKMSHPYPLNNVVTLQHDFLLGFPPHPPLFHNISGMFAEVARGPSPKSFHGIF